MTEEYIPAGGKYRRLRAEAEKLDGFRGFIYEPRGDAPERQAKAALRGFFAALHTVKPDRGTIKYGCFEGEYFRFFTHVLRVRECLLKGEYVKACDGLSDVLRRDLPLQNRVYVALLRLEKYTE